MKNYGLGPNGAIVTALNLYTTKFHQLMDLLGKVNAENSHDIAVIDTPGQIEVFTWSASGQILTESLASTFPTVVVYVMDLERSTSPITFMSNMLYACSVLYKTKLPFIVVLNKVCLKNTLLLLLYLYNEIIITSMKYNMAIRMYYIFLRLFEKCFKKHLGILA